METIVFPLPGRVTVKEPLTSPSSSFDNQPAFYNEVSSRLLPAGTILQCQFLHKDSGENSHFNYEPSSLIFDNQSSLSCKLNSDSNSGPEALNDPGKEIPVLDVDPSKFTDQPDSDSESFIVLDGETTFSETSFGQQEVVEKKLTTFFTNGVEQFKKIGLTTTINSILKNLASNFQRNKPEPQTVNRDLTLTPLDHLDTLQQNDQIPGHLPDHEQADDLDAKLITSESNQLGKVDPLEIPAKILAVKDQQEDKKITSTKDTANDDHGQSPSEINRDKGHEKDNKSDEDLVNQLIEMIQATITESTIEQLVEFLEISKDEISNHKEPDNSFTSKRKVNLTDPCSGEEAIIEDKRNDEVSRVTATISVDENENLSDQHDASDESDVTKSCQPTLPITFSSDCTEESSQLEETAIQPENERSTRSAECTNIEPDQATPLSSPEICDQQASCSTFNQSESTTMHDEEEKQSLDQPKPQSSSNLTNDSSTLINPTIPAPITDCEGNEKRRLIENESPSSSCEDQVKRRRLATGLDISGLKIRVALSMVIIESGWKQDGDRTNRIFQSIYECHGRNKDKIEIAIEKNCIKIYTVDRATRLLLLKELEAINTIVKETSPFQLYVQNPLKPSIQFLVHDIIYNLPCQEFISQIRKWNNWNDEWTVHIESKEWIRKIRKGKISLIVDSRIRDKLEMDDLVITVDNDSVKVFDKFGITQCSVCLRFGHSKCRSRIRCFFCSGIHQDKVRHDKYTESRYCFLCRVSGHTPIAKNCPTLIEEIRSKLELIDYLYKDIFLGNDRSY